MVINRKKSDQKSSLRRLIPKQRRGQVTIFIIVAIVIVALALLVYLLFPQITTGLGLGSQNPSEFLQNCMEEDLELVIETLSLQGGSVSPEHYVVYGGDKVEYLCYTGENYKTCVMQKPLLQNSIEKEIVREVRPQIDACIQDLKKSYEKKGYTVQIKSGEVTAELIPKRIVLSFGESITLQKTDAETFKNLHVALKNNLYELVSIATSILNWEARYGDSETTMYMNYYHDLKVEKKKLGDGTTVYILTDRNTGNNFKFASRSLAWPPGIKQDIYS